MATLKKSTYQRALERIYNRPFEEFYPEVRERNATPERAAAELDCSVTTVRKWDEWMTEWRQSVGATAGAAA